jgi:hypothetical protein
MSTYAHLCDWCLKWRQTLLCEARTKAKEIADDLNISPFTRQVQETDISSFTRQMQKTRHLAACEKIQDMWYADVYEISTSQTGRRIVDDLKTGINPREKRM